MDLLFETDAGPLMLTNVKCWVSTGNLPANVGDILLSRAIMYKLGFDPCAMLREAASFTDAISHTGVVQAVLAVSYELVDDLAEEMDSCFPDMVVVDAAAETAKVKVVLDAKVVEAVTAGCGKRQRNTNSAMSAKATMCSGPTSTNAITPNFLVKLYAEDSFAMTEEILEHVSAQGIMLKVKAITGHKFAPDVKNFMLELL
ncbi:hypothetical protein H257_13196 [Aphanomyces astaci]|uniref:Uncharacterized protein n=1 Tax=Aphanomyces astaci TaxID=112090 RepID=W4FXZ7_APHAT|nr:hypothetical protein H257_13196 [Aphanomyces astaci]ETV71533.1 hypothetical protein H257_13196 [Aphanomyces astaci]|eukprot:XP_009838966.1 hypothetical protein H257_13196 [Aphanomyces astaci]